MIRPAKMEELEEILVIYEKARAFMRKTGNMNQWSGGFPPRELLEQDIGQGRLHVCVRNGRLCGSFYLMGDPDPTYAVIEQGAWRSDEPYGTMHRVASDGTEHGVFAEMSAFAKERYAHLRIDTHADNKVMQHTVEKYGFIYCGIIHLENGDPRMAYEYIKDEQ